MSTSRDRGVRPALRATIQRLGLGLCLCMAAPGCTDDPQDPKMWIKKLEDPREKQEAIRNLVRLKDESAVEPLIKVFKRSKEPEVLASIGKLRSEKAVDLYIEQLDYTEDSFELASAAATALTELANRDEKGRQAAARAVEALNKAATKHTAIRSRANIARIEAMRALATIGDAKAVPALVQILETSADEQDFMLNRDAARHLGTLADASSVPALVRGLFMTGRGTDIFAPCRYALVRIGGPAVDELVRALQRQNKVLELDAIKFKFIPGIIPQKISIVLGNIGDKKAVPALLKELDKKDEGLAPGGVSGHQSAILALGELGDPAASKTLLTLLSNPRSNLKYRVAAAAALNLMNATEALPALLAAAKTPYLDTKEKVIDGEKAGLVAEAVTNYSRLLDRDGSAEIEALLKAAPPDTDLAVAMKNGLLRSALVKECGKNVDCYGKALGDDKSARSEKAAFMLGRLGRDGLKYLQKGVAHKETATRFAVLASLTRVAQKGDKDVLKALADQIELEATKTGLRDLVETMRITALVIGRRG